MVELSPMDDPNPSAPSLPEVTDLLIAWGGGDLSALDRLVPVVHAELRRLARRQMSRERPDHTLQTSALVNEAYLRLIDLRRVQWQDRGHFFAMSARLMRRILVDHARSRNSLKRGAAREMADFEEALAVSNEPSVDLVALDDALKALESRDPRKSQVIEMRFFGGLSVEETAEALQVSAETVKRDWRLAKLWLLRELNGGTRKPPDHDR
jgi:RNA polymerase sigma-70 factor (ECF subfamily)